MSTIFFSYEICHIAGKHRLTSTSNWKLAALIALVGKERWLRNIICSVKSSYTETRVLFNLISWSYSVKALSRWFAGTQAAQRWKTFWCKNWPSLKRFSGTKVTCFANKWNLWLAPKTLRARLLTHCRSNGNKRSKKEWQKMSESPGRLVMSAVLHVLFCFRYSDSFASHLRDEYLIV